MRTKDRFSAFLLLLCCAALLWPRPASAEWRTETIADLRVHLYVPSSPRALLIALHGCTQSPDALRDRGRFEEAAEAQRAVIALPGVPNGGVIAGCWDYYGSDHTLETRHNGALVELVDALVADAALSIDADRIYLIGLSSGAGQTAVIGCLAPDRFAGIGINAGPAVGTSISQAGIVGTDRDTAAAVCRTLAGSRAGGFATQLTSVIHGANDFVVARGYARLNAEIMAEIYRGEGQALTESPIDVSALPGMSPSGDGAIWSDAEGPRVSMIVVDGMGHAFPAGRGDGLETSFVAQHGVAWPEYVLSFFEENNRRADRPPGPDAGAGGGDEDASVPGQDGSMDPEDPPGTIDPEGGCTCASGRPHGSVALLLLCFALCSRRRS